MCDLWFSMCDMWFSMCDIWFSMCDMWFSMCGIWLPMCDIWLSIYVTCGSLCGTKGFLSVTERSLCGTRGLRNPCVPAGQGWKGQALFGVSSSGCQTMPEHTCMTACETLHLKSTRVKIRKDNPGPGFLSSLNTSCPAILDHNAEICSRT